VTTLFLAQAFMTVLCAVGIYAYVRWWIEQESDDFDPPTFLIGLCCLLLLAIGLLGWAESGF